MMRQLVEINGFLYHVDVLLQVLGVFLRHIVSNKLSA